MGAENMQTMKVQDMIENPPAALHNDGNYAFIEGDIYFSSSMPGLIVVETSFGSIYMDPEEEVEVSM